MENILINSQDTEYSINTIKNGDEILYRAKDNATILKIKNVSDSLSNLHYKDHKYIQPCKTKGGVQNMTSNP